MQYCLTSNTSDCRNCYKCIRHCPIKAISFRDDKAEIIAEDCILCGKCYNVCPQHLKEIRNDTDRVRRLVKYSEKVIVSLVAAILYLLAGKDIIPDKVPVVGYVDDLAVFAAAFLVNEPELSAYSKWREEQAVSI